MNGEGVHGSAAGSVIGSRAGIWMVAAWGMLPLAGCGELRIPDPDAVYVAFGYSATRGTSDRDYPASTRGQTDAPVGSEGQ